MKRTILVLSGTLFLNVATIRAQDPNKQIKDSTSVQQSQNYVRNMVRINATEVPASLRSTLQEPQYRGWENATIFRSEESDMYLVEMTDPSARRKAYRFYANGKLLNDN